MLAVVPDPEALLRTLLGILLLTAVTSAVLTVTGAPRRFASALAILRGTIQLALLSVVLSGVIADPRWVALALLVMLSVAASTSARRLGGLRRRLGLVAVGMLTGIGVSLGIVFATGVIEPTPRYLLAIGGIVIGGSMTSATLAGRRVLQAAEDRWAEIEGWLALGATPRAATLPVARHGLHEAVVPTTDQTRTTGLVTLPGAFVGAIFGGLSPLEAGRFQIVVLAALMAAAAVTAAVVAFGLSPQARPGDTAALR